MFNQIVQATLITCDGKIIYLSCIAYSKRTGVQCGTLNLDLLRGASEDFL